MSNVPRPEYPRPQFVRDTWLNLNGPWEFEFDFGKSGRERDLFKNEVHFSKEITVPFCPESELSGINYKDFIPAVWYKKAVEIPADWDGSRIILHFGAADYLTRVWVNGEACGKHLGGYSSFSFDVTEFVIPGENIITVYCEDDVRSPKQPTGKQSDFYNSIGCLYTRTTGIWQTVWLESVPSNYISSLDYVTDIDNSRLNIKAKVLGDAKSSKKLEIEAIAYYEGNKVGSDKVVFNWRSTDLTLNLSELHLWEPGHGRLYDLDVFLYADGELIDTVKSYFGMRTVGLSDNAIYINNKPVFQRLVLDQGFYPDGIYTAPTDEALKNDILISLEAGFNGARLHEKIFEPRFLYWADKLGYLVWGEHANWGLNIKNADGLEAFMGEWIEALERDISHPSIVGWCPFNETQGDQNDNVIDHIYRMTKAIDPTRPVIDSSGWHHVDTDIYDVHDYNQDTEVFKNNYEYFKDPDVMPKMDMRKEFAKRPMPFFVSEYGGIWWAPGKEGWGYGKSPDDSNEFIDRYKELTTYMLEHPRICAFCYTQLYDVEQEVNGLYTYERQAKFDPKIFHDINTQVAAIEK